MRLSAALACCLSLVACDAVAPAPPVADTTMAAVLYDLHLARARAQVAPALPYPPARDSILQAYGLDTTAFDAALAYYLERPADYLRIYGQVADRLHATRYGSAPPPDTAPAAEEADAE